MPHAKKSPHEKHIAERDRMHSHSFGLPKERKFPLDTKSRAISAVAYSKKLAREHKITPQERDIVLRKVHHKFPSIHITPIRGKK